MSSIDMNQPWIYKYSPSRSPLPPPSPPDPSRSSQCTRSEHLSHASILGWWSVSHLIIYMFWCCSLETSHPRLLLQSLKVVCTSVSLFLQPVILTWRIPWSEEPGKLQSQESKHVEHGWNDLLCRHIAFIKNLKQSIEPLFFLWNL